MKYPNNIPQLPVKIIESSQHEENKGIIVKNSRGVKIKGGGQNKQQSATRYTQGKHSKYKYKKKYDKIKWPKSDTR